MRILPAATIPDAPMEAMNNPFALDLAQADLLNQWIGLFHPNHIAGARHTRNAAPGQLLGSPGPDGIAGFHIRTKDTPRASQHLERTLLERLEQSRVGRHQRFLVQNLSGGGDEELPVDVRVGITELSPGVVARWAPDDHLRAVDQANFRVFHQLLDLSF